MLRPRLDAVAVTATDMNRTVAFYTSLGFEFPPFSATDPHVEAIPLAGEARLMIDSAGLAAKLSGADPVPANHSVFALLADSPSEVDRIVDAVLAAGFTVKTMPWDAFWGQRYATVVDPDGYAVDVFAPLSGA